MNDSQSEIELAQRYAARLLEPAAAAAFEEHLLGCERCQTEVRLAVGLRDVVSEGRRARSNDRAWWIGGVSAALAAGVATLLFWPGRVDPRMAALGRVQEPPMYIGMSVRSMPKRGDSLFNVAMAAYGARQYGSAVTGLRAALAAGVDTTSATFFLASAELMAGRPADAVAAYGVLISSKPAAAAYLAEAHMYRARALLQLGRGADALADLAAVGQSNGEDATHARTLADSVRAVMPR